MSYIRTAIRLKLLNVTTEDDQLIHQRLMRRQNAAMRVAYSQLQEGIETKKLWDDLRHKFPLLTGRNLNDAILRAKMVLASQQERLPQQLKLVERQIEKTEAKYQREQSRTRPRPERLQAMRLRMERLQQKQAELATHLEKNTVPPAIFGGRKLWQQASRNLPEASEKWRTRRSNQFYSRGAKNNRGNPHCRLLITANRLQLSVRVPVGIKPKGDKVTTEAIWLTFDIVYSYQFDHLLRTAALDGQTGRASYDVRLIRQSVHEYFAFVTIEETVAEREYVGWESLPSELSNRVVGVDLNLDHLALVLVDGQGQFRRWKVFKYHNLGELPKNKSRWHIGNLARDAIAWATKYEAQSLIIEDLNINRRGGSATFNRRTVPFAYKQLAEALTRRALRERLAVKRVNPAYTSWIGQLKYSPQFGISRHVAAAYVIARRGLELQERIPKKLLTKFNAIAEQIEAGLQQVVEQRNSGGEDDKLAKQIKVRREWLRRLRNFDEFLPDNGHPWLLWVTLYLAAKHISGVRDSLLN